RFVKWHYYLHVIGVRDVPVRTSAVIFVAGLSMVITPGKVGELLKSYLLRVQRGTPIPRSAPIIVAERLTDGVAMVLLASGGLILYRVGWQMLVPVILLLLGVVAVSQHRGATGQMIAIAKRLPIVSKRIRAMEAAITSARELFRLPNLIFAVGIGVISWGGESVALYLVLTSLGLPPSPVLALQAAFILATATLVGAASMLPGGLAAAEGSLAGLMLLLGVTHDPSVAAAATLLIRFATLWLGVAVGLIGLTIAARQVPDVELAGLGGIPSPSGRVRG
ncbi:MAG TPA: lysylphosphatidylglycerol synthase transmembrane domain-containing protein, partial [Chloroflexota bacterium]|nr:lysylphosphatidylglycerol synthase transmembrane domain-containing protein [Chloroflexota bacterium]